MYMKLKQPLFRTTAEASYAYKPFGGAPSESLLLLGQATPISDGGVALRTVIRRAKLHPYRHAQRKYSLTCGVLHPLMPAQAVLLLQQTKGSVSRCESYDRREKILPPEKMVAREKVGAGPP